MLVGGLLQYPKIPIHNEGERLLMLALVGERVECRLQNNSRIMVGATPDFKRK